MNIFNRQKALLLSKLLQKDSLFQRTYNLLNDLDIDYTHRSHSFMELALSVPALWKILVVDTNTAPVVSRLFSKAELLDLGVTLCLGLHAVREKVSAVTAVYFIDAKLTESLRMLGKDFSDSLYDQTAVVFLETPSDEQLVLLNSFLTPKGVDNLQRAKVCALDANFLSLQNDLFVLNPVQTKTFDRPYFRYLAQSLSSESEEIREYYETVIVRLQQVLQSVLKLGVGVVLCAPRRRTAVLDKVLSKLVMFEHESSSKDKVLLFVSERFADFLPLFSHSDAYAALLSDCLAARHFHTTLSGSESVLLGPDDFFWTKNFFLPVTEVSKSLSEELTTYKRESEKALSGGAEEVAELRTRKKVLDIHSVLLEKVVCSAADRKVPELLVQELAGVPTDVGVERESDRLRLRLCKLTKLYREQRFEELKEQLLKEKEREKEKNFAKAFSVLETNNEVSSSRKEKNFLNAFVDTIQKRTKSFLDSFAEVDLRFETNRMFLEALDGHFSGDVELISGETTGFFEKAVYFSVGGSLNEVCEAKQLFRTLPKEAQRNVVYGCTDFTEFDDFLESLTN